MNLRWLIFDFVPPDITLTRQQRRELRLKIKDAISWNAELLGFSISLLLMLCLIIAVGFTAIAGSWLVEAIPIMVAGTWISLSAMRWRFSRRATYAALQEMGYNVCLRCGYWLRGLGDNEMRCPECGWQREPPS